jgi:hypothetical protein
MPMNPQFGVLLVASGFAIAATVLLGQLNRVVSYFLTQCTSDRPETDLRHDLRIGVALMAVAGYVLAVGLAAGVLLPSTAIVWVAGIGIPIELMVYLLYTLRFRNAGLHVFFLWGNQ